MSGGEEGVVSGADGDGNYSSRIQAELLGLASRTNRSNVLINLGASIVVPAVFWDAVEHRSFLLWWGLAVIVWSIFRMTTSIVFRRRQRRDEIEPGSLPFWTSVYGVGVIGAALLWSTATVYLLPSAQLEQTFIILLIVASLAGGSSGTGAPDPRGGPIYIAVLLLPSIALLALAAQPHLLLSALGVAFMLAMLLTLRNNHWIVRRAVLLKLQNDRLVEDLRGMNRTLERRVRERTAELERMATTDSVSALLNRDGLRLWFDRHVRGAANEMDVICVQLPSLPQVNRALGAGVADQVIVTQGRLLLDANDEWVVCRWGDDAFIVIAERAAEDEAGNAAQILELMQRPVEVGARTMKLECAIGLAAFPMDSIVLDELVQAASLAAGRCEASGSNVTRYTAGLRHAQQHNLNLTQALKTALTGDELSIHLQPIVRSADRSVACHEVLLRWHNPILGAVGPDEFIPIAEETGDIVEIGEWVLHRACDYIMAGSPDAPRRLAINVSMKQLLRPGHAARLAGIVHDAGVPPGSLALEITETSFSQGEAHINELLDIMRAARIEVHIDDFGTGYSSLAGLSVLAADAIKIDRQFVHKLDARSIALIESTVLIARKLGMTTVAEGVEDEATWQTLTRLGVDFQQGYFFGRPEPIAETDSEGRGYPAIAALA